MKPKVVILASGGGTTAEAFIRANANGDIAVDVSKIIVSRKDAGIFDRISRLNQELGLDIQCILINHQTHPASDDEQVARGCQTKAEEQAMIDSINASGADLVVLLGYMKRLGPDIVRTFGWRSDYTDPCEAMMLNTHPGLLPITKGLYGQFCQEKVLELGLPEAGQTLHIVAEDYDDGPVIAEHRVKVEPNDTAETLFERVQLTEKQYISGDIEAFIHKRQQFLNMRGE